MSDHRRTANEEEVQAALRNLDSRPDRIPAGHWPAHLSDLNVAGMYSWWVDEEGATALTEGLEVAVEPGRIYAGQTGATKWPSGAAGQATLAGRVGGNHLRGRIRGSTFRLTLASALRDSLEFVVAGPKKLSVDAESRLSGWMRQHLDVAVHVFPDRDALSDLESRVLALLDPPLNLEGRPTTPVRESLRAMRRSLSGAVAPPTTKPPPPTGSRLGLVSSGGKVTLHEEIAAILRERGGGWMTTQEIADEVNRRGRYVKRDGSSMTAFQIHGRTRNYSQLFQRDGSRVRLAS